MSDLERSERDFKTFLNRVDGMSVSGFLQEIQETMEGAHDSFYEDRNYLVQGLFLFSLTREEILDIYGNVDIEDDIISKYLRETEGKDDCDKLLSVVFDPCFFAGYGKDVVYRCELLLGDSAKDYIKRSYRCKIGEDIMTRDHVRLIFDSAVILGHNNILDFYDNPVNIISDRRRGKSARSVAPVS